MVLSSALSRAARARYRALTLAAFFALASLLAVPAADARVVLPESGRLAGSLDSRVSEFGDEFFNFPWYMEPTPAPGNTKMTGWLEVQFGEPVGSKVPFEVIYDGFGADPEFIEFGGGQEYFVGRNRAFPASPNLGMLDLETGAVESIQMDAIFRNTLIAQTDKINRFFFAFPNSYPPPDIGIPVPPVPPGFFYADARFRFDATGQIIGFEFVGQSILPVGPAAQFNDIFGIFPLFSFGPTGEIYWPNPENCKPGTPEFACPTNAQQPDGVLLPDDSLFHPHLILLSDDLRPVAPARPPMPCAPEDLARGAVADEIGGRLYVAGGAGATGEASDRLWIYDPATGAIDAGPALPRPVLDAQGGAIGNRLFVIGGRPGPGAPAIADVQIFDVEADAWIAGPSLPTPVARAGATFFDDNVYVLGGRTGNGETLADVFQVYDDTSGMWFTLPAMFFDGTPIVADAPAAATAGPFLLFMGGLGADGAPSDQTIIFDAVRGFFAPGPPLRWGVYEAAADAAEGRVYLAGGRRAVDGVSDASLQIFETDRGVWLEGHAGPMPLTDAAGAMLRGGLTLVGGIAQTAADPAPGSTMRTVQRFDPRRGWSVCATQPQIVSAGVMNAASLIVGLPHVAPGAQASIVGHNLGAPAFAPPTPTLPTELGGTRVLIDGVEAPLMTVLPNRIDLQVPDGVRTGVRVPVQVVSAFAPTPSNVAFVGVEATSPGIFIQSCGVTDEPLFL
ncbi:MAG: hypothetical protein AAF772_12105, partial [Acidobacteriota bacterium]